MARPSNFLPYSRTDYHDRKCTHEQYYSQFVTAGIKEAVKSSFTLEVLKEAYRNDKWFNTIQLGRWDSLVVFYLSGNSSIHSWMRACGDYLTKAGGVCILKEAARQLVTESNGAG